ncbi:MAG: nucleotidyltransferase family protein [Emticicia sp.]|uniref:nucleotidyltransferase family protein n=1 Tax=Emticicia sp. TaxID=1930953 RepID=UPI003BA4E5B3
MKRSLELEILIESIKVSLLEKPTEQLVTLIQNQGIDWQKLEKLTTFHAIRPVVYHALYLINFENEFSQKLKLRTFTQSIINLSTSQELARLLTLLQNQNIRVLPYKGLLFTHEFYKNQNLRETHDLDLLIHPDDAREALKILLNDGFVLEPKNNSNLSNTEIIDSLLNTFGIIEVGLDKKNTHGIDIHIDFHWQLFEGFYNFKIDFKEFFEQQELKKFLGVNVYFPSKESQFLMLLNHHGGREAWCRLKHFCDLIEFLKTNSFSYHDLLEISSKVEMRSIFEVGFNIYQHIFLNDFNCKKLYPIQLKIYNYWEIGELWVSYFNRLRFEYIKIVLDDNLNLKKLLLDNYIFFSTPNLTENPRLITFSKQFRFLNFCSKVLTFIWKKTLKPIFWSERMPKT